MHVNYRVQWIKELFFEISTVIFFVFTAYKFRPTPFTLRQEENEDKEQMYDSTIDMLLRMSVGVY